MAIRVKLHASDPVTLSGLIFNLQKRSGIVIVGDSEDESADVLVVGVDRLSVVAMNLLRDVSEKTPKPVVLVADEVDETDVLSVVRCGVVEIVSRASVLDEKLAQSVQLAAEGGANLPADLLGHLLGHIETLRREFLESQGLAPPGLSSREIDVLRMLARGMDTRDIAIELNYSERTVKKVISSVTTRLQLRNRSHAVAYAMRAGVI